MLHRRLACDSFILQLASHAPGTSTRPLYLVAYTGDRKEPKIEQEDAQTLEFLLEVLREIDAPEVLHSLAGKTLTNTTEIGAGLPAGAGPRRQLRDLAVNAFVKRLQLSVDFELSEHRRYDAAEIDQVLQQIRNTLPR